DAERDLLAELEIDAVADRQRAGEVDSAELRSVAALEIAHDDFGAFALHEQVLAAYRIRAHFDRAFGTADHHLGAEDDRPGFAQHLERDDGRDDAPRAKAVGALPERRVVRGLSEQLVEGGERFAPLAAGDHEIDVLRPFLARARKTLVVLLRREQELEAFDV